MLATLDGITTLVRLQPRNAQLPMLVSVSGSVRVVSELQLENAFSGILFVQANSMQLPLPIEPALIRPGHPEKA